MRTCAAITFIAASLAALPATAATFSAFDTFSATPGATGPFTYGAFDVNTDAFTPFTSSDCSRISGTICQNSAANAGLPGVYKTNSGAHQSGTVIVPANALILHPGPNTDQSDSVAIEFTAPKAGKYTFSGTAAVSDTNPSGTILFGYVPNFTFAATQIGTLSAASPTFTANPTTVTLQAGQSAFVIVGNGGNYFNDSTAVNVFASTVPEAATWGVMIAGFGMVGFAARRRRSPAVTA